MKSWNDGNIHVHKFILRKLKYICFSKLPEAYPYAEQAIGGWSMYFCAVEKNPWTHDRAYIVVDRKMLLRIVGC